MFGFNGTEFDVAALATKKRCKPVLVVALRLDSAEPSRLRLPTDPSGDIRSHVAVSAVDDKAFFHVRTTA